MRRVALIGIGSLLIANLAGSALGWDIVDVTIFGALLCVALLLMALGRNA